MAPLILHYRARSELNHGFAPALAGMAVVNRFAHAIELEQARHLGPDFPAQQQRGNFRQPLRIRPQEDADYIGRCFLRERQMLVVGSAASQLDSARPLPLVCLPQRADKTQLAILQDGRKVKLQTATVLALSSPLMIRDAVLAGAGAGILPPSLIRQELQDGRLREIGSLADTEVAIWLLYPSRRHVSSRLRAFSDLLLERFPDARMS